jgi:serine/threonine-protein kinase
MRFQPGDAVGPYRVTGVIGEGACGVVYQVVNSVTGRLEAMKILAENYGHDLDQAQRFLREIQLQAKLDHPNIAQVRTAFCEGSTIVLVMELVDGESLGSVLQRGPLTVEASIRVAEQVLNALIMAHHHGVVHRDVKPANILLDRYGTVKLTDFGLAKQYGEPGQTGQGMAVGTVYYMAPEQVRGLATTDWRADLYAVGVVLYEMLTGRRPFDGVEQYAVMRAQIELTPPPVSRWAPDLPKEFDALVERALQKNPAERFQSASGFLAALQELPNAARASRTVPWRYATYAAGIGSMLLAAFAVPPKTWDIPVETLSLQMPTAPPAPPEASRLPTPTVQIPAPIEPAPVRRIPALPVRREALSGVARALPEAPRPIEAPPIKDSPLPAPATTALPLPPKVAPIETGGGAPVTNVPDTVLVDTQVPAEKRSNWMRRGIGKVPKLFRRRDPQPQPPKP